MQIDVNGTRLWFDVDGPALVPDGPRMRERPTLILVHGGPGGYDHTYFKPYFGTFADLVQVVYLDLRDHGRSGRTDPARWSFEICADDLRAFCDALHIVRPIVLGHSMGGFIAMRYGARHPGHARALILQSTMARFDLVRLVESVRRVAGDEVAELAARDYSGDPVSDAEWARVFAAFGPRVLTADELARRVRNPDLTEPGMDRMRRLDMLDQLGSIAVPTLVCVGGLDAITPVTAAREVVAGIPPGLARLQIVDGAGHFPWLDTPAAYRSVVAAFVASVAEADLFR